MRPTFISGKEKLPINHLWAVVERARDRSELRVVPEEIFWYRKEAREWLKEYKKLTKYKGRNLSIRKVFLNV